MDLQAPFFSPKRKINIPKCFVCEQDFKLKKRSILRTEAGKLTFP